MASWLRLSCLFLTRPTPGGIGLVVKFSSSVRRTASKRFPPCVGPILAVVGPDLPTASIGVQEPRMHPAGSYRLRALTLCPQTACWLRLYRTLEAGRRKTHYFTPPSATYTVNPMVSGKYDQVTSHLLCNSVKGVDTKG